MRHLQRRVCMYVVCNYKSIIAGEKMRMELDGWKVFTHSNNQYLLFKKLRFIINNLPFQLHHGQHRCCFFFLKVFCHKKTLLDTKKAQIEIMNYLAENFAENDDYRKKTEVFLPRCFYYYFMFIAFFFCC